MKLFFLIRSFLFTTAQDSDHCPLGFEKNLTENGFMCRDIDECIIGVHNCAPDATCTNAVGSFNCECNRGEVKYY